MSVTVEQTGAVGRRLTITIPSDNIETEVDRQLKTLARSAKIKGFRPGKAPAKIVRREYGAAVRDDVIGTLQRSHLADALESESLDPVGLPILDAGKTGDAGDFVFTAELEIFPSVDPRGLDTLQVKRPRVDIGDSDVDTVLERLQKQNAEWASADRPAQDGDRVTIDFEGLIDGESFEGNRGKDAPVTLGAGEMIPGFEEGLKGIETNETRHLELEFPADYRATDLAGKQAEFEVTAKAIEIQKLPELNAEFAATFGCENGVEQLRERVRENMDNELESRIREDLREQIGNQLIEANPVEVPRALVDQEVERRQRQMLRRLGLDPKGANIPKLPSEPYEEASERHVRLGVVMNALIRREAFQPDPARVEKHIESVCAQLEDPASGARELRADNQAMRGVEALVLEDMLYDWLIEQAQVSEEPKDFLAYMEPRQDGADNATEATNDE